MRRLSFAAYGCILLLTILASPLVAQDIDLGKLKAMEARSIGPAGMSGRVTAIEAVHANPNIIYAGTASGGLWKSTSGGTDWAPIFDEQNVASIGSIAIYQRNPNVIYVGTGEGNPRNSQTSGNGVFKSLDGGKTWTFIGLENTRTIHRIIVHPENADVVYAGVQGAPWGENPERGVYKTTDGGETWEKILYVDEKTGIGDLVMDPSNPNKLIAAMWEYRRWPWFFTSGGPSSGLHVTFDGGKTWTQRTEEDGLPKGELGRIGLAIAPSNPSVVYALIEAKENGLYRSDDGGFKWTKVADQNIGNRPFYYADIFVDSQNENRLYNLYSIVTVSNDGGKTFEVLLPYNDVHPDHHAWWTHPEDPNLLINGNDGGLAISRDRGDTWRFVENLPLAQFYHISYDMETPYNVCGGMQDNGSWCGPSQVWRAGGIRNSYWEEVAFGDGFDVMMDASNPRYGFAMSQGGYLQRFDRETGNGKLIRPIHPDNVPLRFNWNAGIAQDPFDTETIYYGSQFVHKSTDRGDNWTIISPDLTTNDPEKQKQRDSGGLTYDVTGAENFTTILAISPSPMERSVIWVGTDDGNVQVTRDDGATWTNVVGNIQGVAEGAWVPQVHASTYNAGEAFVVFGDHRRNNWEPYLYHTTDYGRSWNRLVDSDDVWGYVLSFVQDPIEPNLMFVGTEFGLYVSFDAGSNWHQWKHGYPTVSTMDLAIHPREHDLIIGTFGRAAYILDDIRPLRALAAEGTQLLDETLHVFEPPTAILATYKQATGTRFAAEAMFAGENRPYGAMISYVVNPPETEEETDGEEAESKPAPKDAIIKIISASGDTLRMLKGSVEPGLNRVTWTLNRKGTRFPGSPEPGPNANEPGGPPVLPGTYTVHISYGDETATTQVTVMADSRLEVSLADMEAKNALRMRMLERMERATEAVDRLRDAQETIDTINKLLSDRTDDEAKATKDSGKAMTDSIKVLRELVNNPSDTKGIRGNPLILSSRLGAASGYLNSSWEAPTETNRIAVAQAEESLQAVIDAVNAFFADHWPTYQETVDAANISFFESYTPLRIDNR